MNRREMILGTAAGAVAAALPSPAEAAGSVAISGLCYSYHNGSTQVQHLVAIGYKMIFSRGIQMWEYYAKMSDGTEVPLNPREFVKLVKFFHPELENKPLPLLLS